MALKKEQAAKGVQSTGGFGGFGGGGGTQANKVQLISSSLNSWDFLLHIIN